VRRSTGSSNSSTADLCERLDNASLSGQGKMKKVLMIVRAFPPFSPVGYSIRVIKFIKYLPALGWMPVVLTIDDQKEYETTRKVGSETLLSEISPQVKIYRTAAGEPSLKFVKEEREFGQRNWLTRAIVKVTGGVRRWAFRNIFLPDRYLTWLPFAVRQGRKIVSNEGIDVIFSTCTPYSVTLAGACLKRLTGKPLILDFRDDWVGTPWYHSRPKMIQMIERRLEGWAVKTADKVVVVTELSKNAFLDRYPKEPEDKFVFIPNGCDLEEFAALNSMAAVPNNSKFTIVHAGSLNDSNSWTRSPATLFHAVQRLIQRQPELADDMALVFAGDFPERFRILADELGLSRVVKALGHLPHDEVLHLLKSADLLLAIGTQGCSTLIPGKLYEYWAIGGPPILLVKCCGAATSFIERYRLGLTVEPLDVVGIQQAILTVYRQSKTASPMRISTAGIEAYDRRALTQKLAQVLAMVCNGRE
jgi:glycosyltransferase involved in cell wall biosynthesis